VAILNAVSWSLITPPFQVPDEPSHVAYVKQLAETHSLPTSHSSKFSSEEHLALTDLHQANLPFLPPTGRISSRAQQRELEHDLAQAAEQPREGSSAAGVATSEPPLYYLLEAIPYTVGSHGTLLTRLELMRLLSGLFAGITAMFAFLFVRETLPASRAAWVAGGLSVAFAPLLGFMSGAVNPDSLLFAMAAALFWSLARAFRRGFTYRRATVIGAITAAGLLTKVNFVGLFPGAIVGLGVLAWRMARRSSRSSAYRAFGLGAGIAASPVVLYAIINVSSNRPTFGLVTSASTLVHGGLIHAISHAWQLFLPRLPGMKSYEAGIFTTRQIWFNGFVGQYGWVETAFPEWVYGVAAIFAGAVILACVRTLVQLRSTVRERLAELAVYATMGGGLLILIGGAAYFSPEGGESYTQARYLLPLLALFAAGLGLAARAAGRRWEAVLGTVLVLAMIADDIFSQLLVIARYYG